jgi:LPXTG-motif cell wall-anchored protein
MNIWRSLFASTQTQNRPAGFRHNTRAARVTSSLSAAAIAALLVLGSGAAYGDDTGSDPTAPSTSAPADPATDAPAAVATDTPSAAPTDPPSTDAPATDSPAPAGSATTDSSSGSGGSSTGSGDHAGSGGASTTSTSSGTKTFHSSLAKLISAPIINALTINCLPGSPEVGGFEIDGDTCVESGQDWDNTGASVVDGLGDSTTFHGGTSEGDDPAGWALGGPAPNGKTDIETAWAYSKAINSTVYGYFGISNDSTSGGTSQYDVEYNQLDPVGGMPNREPGDLLFRFNSTGNAAISFTDAKKWLLKTDPAWGAGCQAITTTAGWCTIPIPANAFAQQVNSDGTFFEGAINIGLFFGNGTCSGDFGSVDIRSVTGNSFYSSSLKDYVTPLSVDTPSTCGKIIINKKDENGTPIAGATFSISPNPVPGGNPQAAFSVTDNDSNDQNPADGVIEVSPVTPNVDYTVTETAAPTGYLLDDPSGTSTNPQHVGPSGTITFNFVDHKKWLPLTLSKTATPTYHASYGWQLVKEIAASPNGPWFADTTANAPLIKKVAEGAANAGTLYYRATVTEGAPTTSDYLVSGTLHVGNPNSASVTATLGDSLPGGTCAIAGNASPYTVAVPAGGADYAYVCDLGDTPAPANITGNQTNTATVGWDKSTYPQTVADVTDAGSFSVNATAGYAFGAPTSTTNKSVTITDNRFPGLNATYTWTAQGTTHVSSYDTSHTVSAGSCTAVIDNTATLTGDNAATVATDSAYGKICVGSDLSITRLDAETLTRTYPWSIEKSTSTPKVYVKDGHAIADYTVTVTAGDGVDSAWNITGTITVHNPNDWETVDVTSLPVSYTGGGTCAVTGESFPVTIAKSGTHDFAYSCNFVSQPDYNGTINATVNWDATAASTPDSSTSDGKAIVEADWSKTLVNDTVVVHDDNATPGDTSDDTTWNLDWATVHALANQQKVITYSVDLSGDQLPAIGTCANRVNTVSVTGDDDVVLDADNNAENNSATVEVCNPYTQISVLKTDFETGEPLAGAEFALFQNDVQIGTATSGADGIAVFDNKLLPGTYTVTETKAPDGYDLPVGNEGTVTVTIDNITDPDSNFVENGVMPPITFRDPATGQIAIVSKQHFERDAATNDWVPSDGAVDFGQEVRYVVNVTATGHKLFHNVTVTDYVPGYNPADVTSTGKGVLETGTAICSGDFTCTATEDMTTGLVTWTLTGTGQATGVVRGDATGEVEMVVRMPDLPTNPPFVNGVYSTILWNIGYLDWDQATFAPAPSVLARAVAAAVDLPMEHHSLTSNEVTDEARAFEPAPPVVSPPPPAAPGGTPLPNTGGPSLWLLLLGLGLALGGTALVLSDRRYRRRS